MANETIFIYTIAHKKCSVRIGAAKCSRSIRGSSSPSFCAYLNGRFSSEGQRRREAGQPAVHKRFTEIPETRKRELVLRENAVRLFDCVLLHLSSFIRFLFPRSKNKGKAAREENLHDIKISTRRSQPLPRPGSRTAKASNAENEEEKFFFLLLTSSIHLHRCARGSDKSGKKFGKLFPENNRIKNTLSINMFV